MTIYDEISERNQTIHVVERSDEQGTYCLVYTGDTPEGEEATCQNLEAAAWAIVGDGRKRSVQHVVTVHVDNDVEYERYRAAERAATSHYDYLRRVAAAPRDRQTGRPLFMSYR